MATTQVNTNNAASETAMKNATEQLVRTSRKHLKIASNEASLADTLERPMSVGFSVEEMAKRLGMSISFVYAHVQKDRPMLPHNRMQEDCVKNCV